MRMMGWGLEMAQHPGSQESFKGLGPRGGGAGEGREEEEREGAQPQHGEVEMWRWSGYLMAGG